LESVRIEVSQPSAVDMLQSAKSPEHVVTRHVPVEHSPVPPAGAQMEPHEPQSAFVMSGVSHPSIWFPLQLPQLRSHVSIAHVPVAQVDVAFGRPQTVPHPPQWVFVSSSCSQPSTATPLQSPQPASQRITRHDPASQSPIAT
jgi:hypothetical protein